MNSRSQAREVVIAGAGVAGLACANALANRGIQSVVLETSRELGLVDRGDIPHHRSVELLRSWQAWQEVERRGAVRFGDFKILDQRGRRLFAANVGELLGKDIAFTSVRHRDLVLSLALAASRTGLVTIRPSARVTHLVREGSRVVGVQTRSGQLRADLTVVAAGSRSPIARQYFGREFARGYGVAIHNLWLDGTVDGLDNVGAYVVAASGVLVIVPLPGGSTRLGVQVRLEKRAAPLTATTSMEYARDRLELLSGWEPKILASRLYPLRATWNRSWALPGAVLAGDAARTVHPLGGLGMNLAIGDAQLLAGLMTRGGFATPVAVDHACHTYDALRRRQVRSRVMALDLIGILASGESQSTRARLQLVARLLDRSTLAKRWLLAGISAGD